MLGSFTAIRGGTKQSSRHITAAVQTLERRTMLDGGPPALRVAPDPVPEAGIRVPLSSLPQLSSRPGAPRTLFLDFDGDAAATWNNGVATYQVSGPLPGNSDPVPAFDWDGNAGDFSDSEIAAINTLWQITAEKYSPFNINVTTVDPGNVTNDLTEKVIIGGSPRDWFQPNPVTNPTPSSGVSTIGGFTDPNLPNTCYVFGNFYPNNSFFVGNIIAHEAGHAFGLTHQRAPGDEYYNGDSGRAPIMGDSGNERAKRGIWWRTNMEPGQNSGDPVVDELATLESVLGYRVDDRGNDAASAHPMSGSAGEVYSSGVIERVGDSDWFSFSAVTSTAQITVAPAANAPMLAPYVELRNAAGFLMATGVPDGSGNLVLSATNLTPGASYRVVVEGQGFYGDVGQYTVTGALGAFASLNTTARTIYVMGIFGQADNISVYANLAQGTIVIGDNGGTQSWPVNLVDNVVISLFDELNDRVDIYPINPLGNPRIRVAGGGGNDELNIYGTANVFPSSGNDVFTVDAATAAVAADGALYTEIDQYVGFEQINAWGDVGNDWFNVNALPAGTNLAIYGQDGFDWAMIGSDRLDSILGNVAFSGGNDTDVMALNDYNHPAARSYLLSLGYIAVGSLQFNYGAPTTENVIVHGAAGGATINAAAVLSGVNWTLNGGVGDDNIVFGGSFQNVTAATQGSVTVNGGSGNDTITFNDQGGTSDFVVGSTDVFFNGTPGIVHYNAGLENIAINGGNSGNYFNIDGGGGMVVQAAVQIFAGGGNDTISIASSTLSLSNIGADVAAYGEGGSDTLFVHNQNGAARNETLTSTAVSDGSRTYSYGGIEALSIDLSNFDETIYIGTTSPEMYTTIYANNGNDTCYFLTSDLAGIYGVTFQGQGGTDAAVLNDQSATGIHTYAVTASTVSRGTFAFSHSGLESLELNASTAADVFNVTGGGPPTTINAADGNDTFTLTDVAGSLSLVGGGGLDSVAQNFTTMPIEAFWRTLITDTQVRHLYRTSLPINGPYTNYSTVNYQQIHSYVIDADYAGRFEVLSTPEATNIAIHGPADGASFRVGSSSLLAAGSGNVDSIRGLLQFFGAPGAFNSLTVDDGADTTGDTARVVPYLIYNGPGSPLFAPGGSVNYYNFTSTTIVLGSGADTVYTTPGNQNPMTIHGQDPATAPGDTLNLAFAAVTSPIFTPSGDGAGGYTFGNAQPINYTGFEATAVDAVAPAVSAQAFAVDGVKPAVEFTFSEDVSSQLNPTYLTLTNLTTGQQIPSTVMSLAYDPITNRARFTFPGLPDGILPDGNYRAVLSFQVSDLFGNLIGQDQTLDFFVLAGDANRDRTVGIADFAILAGRFNQRGTFTQGDFDYSGTVGLGDFAILASKFNTSLPALDVPARASVAAPGAPVAASPFSRERVVADVLGSDVT